MINLIYRGAGAGRYAGYVAEGVKRIQRLRPARITTQADSPVARFTKPYTVCVHHGGSEPLTQERLIQILSEPTVTFIVGDSSGIPHNLLIRADATVSLSAMPLSHTLEIAALVEQIYLVLECQQQTAMTAPALAAPTHRGRATAETNALRSHRGVARRASLLARYSTSPLYNKEYRENSE